VMGIIVMISHLNLCLCFRLDLKLLWPGQSIEQKASSLFLDFYQNVFLLLLLALVLSNWGWCHWRCQLTCICCLSRDCCACDAWCMYHNSSIFCSAYKFFFACYLVDPVVVPGDIGHEFAQSA
jgi:hypothetical protein